MSQQLQLASIYKISNNLNRILIRSRLKPDCDNLSFPGKDNERPAELAHN